VPIAVFVAAYFMLLSIQIVRFDRNLIPLAPALIVLIGIGFESVRLLLQRRMAQSRLRTALLISLACAVFVPGLVKTISETASAYSVDTREEART
jgi:branched-subunit amino acid ABC-type transport system permease component